MVNYFVRTNTGTLICTLLSLSVVTVTVVSPMIR